MIDLESTLTQLGALGVPYGLKVLGALLILVIGRVAAGFCSRLVRRAMGRAKVDDMLGGFMARLTFVAVLAFAVVAALAKFGIQTASFIALLGAAGFAIGMALQGSLSNFASGVMIILFRPFKTGDTIDAGGVLGTVRAIHLFTTEIATPDNIKVIAPNSTIFNGTIRNFSSYDSRRVDISIGVGYGVDLKRAMEVALATLRSDPRVIADPPPQVFVTELADSSVTLVVRFWVRRADFWSARCDLTQHIKEHYDVQGIEIPFPQRVVHTVGRSG